jgi:hypothetical protein
MGAARVISKGVHPESLLTNLCLRPFKTIFTDCPSGKGKISVVK